MLSDRSHLWKAIGFEIDPSDMKCQDWHVPVNPPGLYNKTLAQTTKRKGWGDGSVSACIIHSCKYKDLGLDSPDPT